MNIALCSKALFSATSFDILIDGFTKRRNVTPLPEGVALFNEDTKIADLLPGEWEYKTNREANVCDILGDVSGMPR